MFVNKMNLDKKRIFALFYVMSELPESSSSTSSSSDDEEIEMDIDRRNPDLSFFPLLQTVWGRSRQRVENYIQLVELWSDIEFKEHLRLCRGTAQRLIDELDQSRFIAHHSFGVKPISGKLCFIIFLWFMANTEPLRTLADRFNVSISSIFRVVRRVNAWLLTIMDSVIKWPHGDSAIRVREGFFAHRNIPGVIGAIDCTHIRIQKPAENADRFCNRKKFFSVHLQAVVDSETRFTNVFCGEPGSMHDARVLRRSSLYRMADAELDRVFPENSFILGDSAYPSLPWLVPPFRDNGHLTPRQTEFNFLHSSTRMAVERAFGALKGRFRRIKFFTEYRDMKFISDVVIAACILHNLCIDSNDLMNDEDIEEPVENNEMLNPNLNLEEHMRGDRRMELLREIFGAN